ncbi:unnamed protein product [Owenia fusiformis]|uniref:Uncharacterized protein n=1 Tax=Owenia fusiformis TaxID=6347 RepID=A0A8J1THF6_OWEFU|nr:unnamed protein product [Owenia fusiformis]
MFLVRLRRLQIKLKRNLTWATIRLGVIFMSLIIIYRINFSETYINGYIMKYMRQGREVVISGSPIMTTSHLSSIYSVINQDKIVLRHKDKHPGNKDQISGNKEAYPSNKDQIVNKDTNPSNKDQNSGNKETYPSNKDQSGNKDTNPRNKDEIPGNTSTIQGNKDIIVGNKNTSKVLIVGYMKGGSSLMGEVFNQNAAAMYWFEPLFGFYGDLYNMVYSMAPWLPKQYRNGTLRSPPLDEETMMMTFFRNLFACNPYELPVELLSSIDFVIPVDSISFKQYTNCVERTYNSTMHALCKQPVETCHEKYMRKYLQESCKTPDIFNLTLHSHRQIQISKNCLKKQKQEIQSCLGTYEKSCQSVNILAAKTIRMSMRMVEPLLQQSPDMKIIHYVRDPRGIQESRGLRHMYGFSLNVTESGRHLCSLMRDDISVVKRLNREYNDAVIQVKYEDLALNNEDKIRRIYKHIGQDVPVSLLKWFKSVGHTCNSNVEDCTKANSRQGRWTEKLTNTTMNLLSTYCQDVLQYFKYEVDLN